MRLPPIKKFLMEDFQDQTTWIGKLFSPLNEYLTVVANGLSNGLTIQENMLAQIKTVLVNGASPSTSFTWKFSARPIGCVAIGATLADGTPALNPQITWTYSAGIVQITSIAGLDTTKSYNITFHVIGG